MTDYTSGLSIAYEVEVGVIRNHEEALEAWRKGVLPTAQPPSSPISALPGSIA